MLLCCICVDLGANVRLRCHSCQLDLSTLAKEHTHHLELPLEEARGFVVLLITLTASAHVSIADLSVTPLDDPQERREILNRYVRVRKLPNSWFPDSLCEWDSGLCRLC